MKQKIKNQYLVCELGIYPTNYFCKSLTEVKRKLGATAKYRMSRGLCKVYKAKDQEIIEVGLNGAKI